jgi:Muconolactone delta-isomerase
MTAPRGMAALERRREKLKELTEAGTVLALYIQADQGHVWLVLEGTDEGAMRQALESLPLYGYVTHLDLATPAG